MCRCFRRWPWQMVYVDLLCLSNRGCLHSNWTCEAVPCPVPFNLIVETKCWDCLEDKELVPVPVEVMFLCCLGMRLVYLCVWNVLLSGGCWNKGAQTGRLETTENPSPPVLEARGPNPGVARAAPPGGSRGRRACSLRLPAPGLPGLGLGLVHSSLQPPPRSSRGLVLPLWLASLLPFIRMHVFGFRAPPGVQNDLTSRSLMISGKTPSPLYFIFK